MKSRIASRRDLEFQLFEVLDAEALAARPRFAEHSRETFLSALDTAFDALFDLTGKAALVTGGSRGLGLQMAEGLGEMGARIAITARKQPELDEAARRSGRRCWNALRSGGSAARRT